MKDIFTDLYNKVVDFFTKSEEKEETKNVARNRLKDFGFHPWKIKQSRKALRI